MLFAFVHCFCDSLLPTPALRKPSDWMTGEVKFLVDPKKSLLTHVIPKWYAVICSVEHIRWINSHWKCWICCNFQISCSHHIKFSPFFMFHEQMSLSKMMPYLIWELWRKIFLTNCQFLVCSSHLLWLQKTLENSESSYGAWRTKKCGKK